MTQIAGHQPALRRLALVDGQDFTDVFPVVGESMPSNTAVTLQLLNRDRTQTYGIWPLTEVWSADGQQQGWSAFIDAADHAPVPHGGWFRLYAAYPAGGTHCWIAGPIERNRR